MAVIFYRCDLCLFCGYRGREHTDIFITGICTAGVLCAICKRVRKNAGTVFQLCYAIVQFLRTVIQPESTITDLPCPVGKQCGAAVQTVIVICEGCQSPGKCIGAFRELSGSKTTYSKESSPSNSSSKKSSKSERSKDTVLPGSTS